MTQPSELSVAMPYPWQLPVWERVNQQLARDAMPHALMLVGPSGIGKSHFATALAQRLLCQNVTVDLACNQCKACLLNQAQTHPDLKWIEPEDGKQLKIDQIRRLQEFLANTAQQGGRKLVVLGPAESLNVNAANALLKSLEEPTPGTHLLLYSHATAGVLATIRSRCQVLKLATPDHATALSWLSQLAPGKAEDLLAMANGAPMLALALQTDDAYEKRKEIIDLLGQVRSRGVSPLAVAAKLAKADFPLICSLLVAQLEASVYQSMTLPNGQQPSRGSQSLFKLRDRVLALKGQVERGGNPNQQLALEGLLLDLSQLPV